MSYIIHTGSNLDVLPTLPDNSIDAIVTDPPYELGFMGKSWDSTGISYNVALWKECLRVLKPGGHLLAFSGSRTYHRMTCAIEDAGFEVRDQIMWVYGSGFPKSHNIGKAVDKLQGNERVETGEERCRNVKPYDDENGWNSNNTTGHHKYTKGNSAWEGWGTALKPAHEPICLARKPFEGTVADNVLKWGVGGLNIDGCRVATDPAVDDPRLGGNGTWKSDKMAANVYEGGYAGNEIGSSPKGRFPANLMHDGSQQVLDLFPSNAGAAAPVKSGHSGESNGIYNDYAQRGDDGATFYADKGSAARFFYCPKATKKDRDEGCDELETKEKPAHMRTGNGTGEASMKSGWPATQRKNTHPTVKPTDLMRYLCRLITPTGGTVLDPFNGSGSTGKAAVLEGFNYVGIELSPEYVAISEARIKNNI